MTTIGLCMIVKNESAVILRCLRSVRPLIDDALIVDTGSADETVEIARNYLAAENLPGEVIDEPWRDFAYNRSFALAKLRERTGVDYALVMDADDTLVVGDGFDASAFKRALDKDFYHVDIRVGPVRFWRAQILSNRAEFTYKGVLHEFVAAPATATASQVASGLHIRAGTDGARSHNPNKYRDDAATLEKALETETDAFMRARYVFYLAQSWMNAGEKEKALATYLRRAELGFWDQEIFLSLYRAAQMKEALGHADHDVIGTYLKAYETDPTRVESLHGAMDYCRRHHKPHQAYLLGRHAIALPEPKGGLFVASWIYDYGLLEEFAVAAYRSGHYQDCVQAVERLLREGKIPDGARDRLRENARAAAAKLKGSAPGPEPAALPRPACAGAPAIGRRAGLVLGIAGG